MKQRRVDAATGSSSGYGRALLGFGHAAGGTWRGTWGIKPRELFLPAPFTLVTDLACGPCLAANAQSAIQEQQLNLVQPFRPRGQIGKINGTVAGFRMLPPRALQPAGHDDFIALTDALVLGGGASTTTVWREASRPKPQIPVGEGEGGSGGVLDDASRGGSGSTSIERRGRDSKSQRVRDASNSAFGFAGRGVPGGIADAAPTATAPSSTTAAAALSSTSMGSSSENLGGSMAASRAADVHIPPIPAPTSIVGRSGGAALFANGLFGATDDADPTLDR